ncbi:uncharacterized protein LOC119790525 isoform X2 [Cyprinodon tularosa]|uniref:uncharacterized protein LOC119790525 isoform X2 n=1 Tax=Cyprinodon tularosa TaxID=77115 RepID=UPI0018E1E47B|nr:uncharacterized protein LOC119790525 isoform X2 [Cyprinodon tularosa]
MTRPKFRPCPKCETPNQANRKTCFVCHQSLSTKKNLKEKLQIFDHQWREAVLKNRNASRVIYSAQIAVSKLHALGFKPILFFAKQQSSSKWVADITTHLETTDTTKNFLDKMQRAYEFLVSVGTPVPVQPQTSTEDAFTHKEQLTGKNVEDLINEPKETTAQEQLKISPQSQEETVIVLDLVPVPPPPPPIVPSSSTFQTKRARSPSPAASPTDQPDQESSQSPAANAISSSQGGLCDTDSKKRKRCRKCSRQKVFLFDSITGHRTNAGKEEVKIHWLPCSACGKIWEDTWEPACQFSHVAVPQEEPLPSDNKQAG